MDTRKLRQLVNAWIQQADCGRRERMDGDRIFLALELALEKRAWGSPVVVMRRYDCQPPQARYSADLESLSEFSGAGPTPSEAFADLVEQVLEAVCTECGADRPREEHERGCSIGQTLELIRPVFG